MNRPCRAAAAGLLLASLSASASRDDPAPEDRLRRAREQIVRLQAEMDALAREERGVLGALEALEARLRLRDAEIEELEARGQVLANEVRRREARLETLERDQRSREEWLRFRIRELYRSGPLGGAAIFLGDGGLPETWEGIRTVLATVERDARTLAEWRRSREVLVGEVERLVMEREALDGVVAEGRAAAARLESDRRARAAALERIRTDRDARAGAVAELEEAAAELARLSSKGAGENDLGRAPVLDIRKFRGLLEWPADRARVAAGFGDRMHPRFRTVVPHPGLDLEVPEGSTFRAVFDGQVVYASILRGYGLTALVDHGGGMVSVYAQASALLVTPGQAVVTGQPLGRVGDPSTRGAAGIYFELRDGGRPVDPRRWLRRR